MHYSVALPRRRAHFFARPRKWAKERAPGWRAKTLRFAPCGSAVARAHVRVRQATRANPRAPFGARPQGLRCSRAPYGVCEEVEKNMSFFSCSSLPTPFCGAERMRTSRVDFPGWKIQRAAQGSAVCACPSESEAAREPEGRRSGTRFLPTLCRVTKSGTRP